jgi:tRNA threonylcarbamoyladenosine biosynthesis protein TsaB
MLLAIDTSTRSVGIAIYDGNQFICQESWVSRRFHTVELAKAVQINLERSGLTARDLTVLGIAIGPGSFTGLRIGLALVKGIAYTQGLPVIGIPTLDISARAIPTGDHLLVAVLEAGRNRLAAAWYQVVDGAWQSSGRIENLTLEELAARIDQPCILTGEISLEMRQSLQDHPYITPAAPGLAMRSPKYLAELAWERWMRGEVDDVLGLSPFYLQRGDPVPK